MSFGKWLAGKREAAELTQGQLAKRVGVSVSYISALERDEPNAKDGSPRRPRIEKVEALAKAMRADIDEARLAAGYAPSSPVESQGFFSGYHDLSPDRQELARRQIKAILDSLADKEHDTNYIDDE